MEETCTCSPDDKPKCACPDLKFVEGEITDLVKELNIKQQDIQAIKGLIDGDEKANGPFRDGGVLDEWIVEAQEAGKQVQSRWTEFRSDLQQIGVNYGHNAKKMGQRHFIRVWFDFLKSWNKTGEALRKKRKKAEVL